MMIDQKSKTQSIEDLATSRHADIDTLAAELGIDEKKLMRKIDWHVLPVLCGFYLLQSIDKGNIGLAKLGGIQNDTHTSGSLFNWAVSMFYLGYVVAEIPCNLALQRINPRWWISSIGLCWGVVVCLMSLTNSFATLSIARCFLGVFEAGVLPASVLITALWYKRSEHALRTAIWFSFSSLGSAVGGLISYGIQSHLVYSSIRPWQWLMIIEGVFTIAWALVSYVICPNVPEKAGFLTENERTFILNRQRLDKTQTSLTFDRRQAIEAILDYKTWFLFCIYFIWQAVNIAFSTFNPSIIAGLGYSNLNAQLLSAPFALFNLLIQLVVSWSSDRFNDRSYHLIACGLLSIVGYACIVAIPTTPQNSGLLYGLLFFTSFNSGSLTLILGWMTNTIIGHTKRVVASSIIIIGSSLGGFVGSLIYQDGQYSRGHIINLTLISVALILAAVLRSLLMWENRRRDKLANEDPSLARSENLVEDVDIIVKENFTDKDPRVRYNL
ncbi:hypothetical protein INT44_005364 [Umbelopsis vinacea]|uniref:Major facilitator superfamily (MFS) profile domain-containing protein n=1 Tax=Umbelopsis vinacea TaxID=44442 RepID=A0A8H7UQX6_9FUNG|nr:hypothetical protein INT44_005364 [Umbelopsis vinacea]KAI9287160.1 major facilitator superfamily domain-containing protein [Umbelopsis sp. AD052]